MQRDYPRKMIIPCNDTGSHKNKQFLQQIPHRVRDNSQKNKISTKYIEKGLIMSFDDILF